MWLSGLYYMGHKWNVHHVDLPLTARRKEHYTPIVGRGFNHRTITLTVDLFIHIRLETVKHELDFCGKDFLVILCRLVAIKETSRMGFPT